ncbi:MULTISPECIES: GNAT family N-acetyltransferase [Bordetella]|uniref:GNAT family N-acetyltransferase n=2 Tax=Bordetella TaxID=517 RepID=A0A261W0P0_9BORD|nr:MULTISPECIES: GNAT family N-acetyltransferase [Bordetella]MDM9558049.1 GNAT family N-acetyltransferase [Bordetella petrii]OZI79601.1 GNAT family N-acetyltransferase [Bordetella genomosp. 2]
MDSPTRLAITTSLSQVDARQWNALAGAQPFVRHEFLSALHDTGCAAPDTGWAPHYLLLQHGEQLAGAVPLYLKSHSRGEYVFDYAWADAFERHGLRYYPKLLAAVPFTPVGGPRLLAAGPAERLALARGLIELARGLEVSSLHVLFPDARDLAALREAGYLVREGVQFHWNNAGYADLDAFLAALNHDKRKKIRQDRKKVQAAGIRYRWLRGAQVDAEALAFFYRCYRHTYFAHGNPPYLSAEFFRRVHAAQPDALVLILAERDGEPVAAALNMQGGDTLYGRYWGALEFVAGLHFETCYLQSIDYCIRHGLARFEGGAQGEHKMARGLLPAPTWSAHWIADARFAAAIEDFLGRETRMMDGYLDELEAHTPFRRA